MYKKELNNGTKCSVNDIKANQVKKALIGLLLTACFLFANGIALGVEVIEPKEEDISSFGMIVKGLFMFIASVFVLSGTITIFKDKEFNIFTIDENK